MGKVGGRRAWASVPSTLICGGVVVVLLCLAVPGIPGAIAVTGDILRTGTAAAATATPAPTLGPVATTDCRRLYPDGLWNELAWAPDSLLAQDAAAPATRAAAVTTALAPGVLLSCSWRSELGALSTTYATVRAGAASVARAALQGSGYACTDVADGVKCILSTAEADEEIQIRGERWLSTSYRGWHPTDYGDQLARAVWR